VLWCPPEDLLRTSLYWSCGQLSCIRFDSPHGLDRARRRGQPAFRRANELSIYCMATRSVNLPWTLCYGFLRSRFNYAPESRYSGLHHRPISLEPVPRLNGLPRVALPAHHCNLDTSSSNANSRKPLGTCCTRQGVRYTILKDYPSTIIVPYMPLTICDSGNVSASSAQT
jgi:hypothetical protein